MVFISFGGITGNSYFSPAPGKKSLNDYILLQYFPSSLERKVKAMETVADADTQASKTEKLIFAMQVLYVQEVVTHFI